MRYRAAIVGAGAPIPVATSNREGYSIGYYHARGYMAHPNVDVVAVVDLRPENAQALADHVGGAKVYTSISDLRAHEQIDVISVCTWPTLHCEMVVDAFAAGVRMVLCEKPMAVSLEEADRMVAAADKAGGRLFINHQRRYAQPFAGAGRLIADGHLGELLRCEAYVGEGWDLMSWGSHWVDMARFYGGDGPVPWVFAAADRNGNVRYGHYVEDQVLVQFPVRETALATLSLGPHLSGHGLFVTGTKGSMHVTGSGAQLALYDGRDSAALHREYLDVPADVSDGFAEAIADMIAATEQHRPSLIDGTSGQADTEIIMAAYASATSGHVEHLPLQERNATLRAPAMTRPSTA